MSRRKLIAGNWKMNKTALDGMVLMNEIKAALPCGGNPNCNGPEILVCPPFTTLTVAVAESLGTCIKVGAQNVHWASNGAFTGEISAEMLRSVGITYVIIGHSERRQYFGETDATVNQRTKAAVAAGLTAVVCVGETLTEREASLTMTVVEKQIRDGLAGLTAEQMKNVVIAYEPVWAIGTGKVATDDQAQEVHAFIRKNLTAIFGIVTAEATRILYGGSMNPTNAAGLLAKPDIDGGLIGGASLKAQDFVSIIKAAQ